MDVLEKYELANGAVYEIVYKMNITPAGWVYHELWYTKPEEKGKQVKTRIRIGAADYTVCRRYIEEESLRVRNEMAAE